LRYHGEKGGAREFLAFPDDAYDQQRIKVEKKRWIRQGVTPSLLKDVLGYRYRTSDLPKAGGEVVWERRRPKAGGRAYFRHKYLPGYKQYDIPYSSYTKLTEYSKQLRELADGQRTKVVMDIPSVRGDVHLLSYLFELLPRNQHWLINAGGHFHALTQENRADLARNLVRHSEDVEYENNSSGLILGFAVSYTTITITKKEKRNKNKSHEGSFWKHLFQPHLDPKFTHLFERFGIFQEMRAKNYQHEGVRENCLVQALRSAGIEESLCIDVRGLQMMEMMHKKSLHQVARTIKANIYLDVYKPKSDKNKKGYFEPEHKNHKDRDGNKLPYPFEEVPIIDENGEVVRKKNGGAKPEKVGTKYDRSIKLALIDGHYIHDCKIPVVDRVFDDDEYEKRRVLPNWWRCKKLTGNDVKSARYIKEDDPKQTAWATSKSVIAKMRYVHYDKFFKQMPMDDEMLKTVYYHKAGHIFEGDLGGSPTMPCDSAGSIWQDVELKKKLPQWNYGCHYHQVYADFETNTWGGTAGKREHVDYCCAAVGDFGFDWIGETGEDMLEAIGKHFKEKGWRFGKKWKEDNTYKPIQLYFHNSGYDFNFLVKYLTQEKICQKGNKDLIVCFARYYMKDGSGWYPVVVKNTYKMLAVPLAEMPAMFGFKKDMVKEVMAYNMYNPHTLSRRWLPMAECEWYLKLECQDVEQFRANCVKWNLIDGQGRVDILRYSQEYCRIDCKVLKRAYDAFDKEAWKAFELPIHQYYTLQTLVDEWGHTQGVYEDVRKLSGATRAYVQEAYWGGKTMMRNNEPQLCEEELADEDANSLFASAQEECPGYPKGEPTTLTPEQCNFEFLNSIDWYVITVEVLEVGKKRAFPVLNVKTPSGGRNWTNDTVGQHIIVDKCTVEDAVEFQQYEFKVLQGVYWNDGFNPIVCEATRKVYDNRSQAKADAKEEAKRTGNPVSDGLQKTYKMCLVSSYGKNALKPVEVDIKYVKASEWDVWFSKNYEQLGTPSYVVTRKGVHRARVRKPIDDHFNRVHCAGIITSYSKRIMNRVMCTAEDAGIRILYMDTDSMQMKKTDSKRLAEAYDAKYNPARNPEVRELTSCPKEYRPLYGKDMAQFSSDYEMEGCVDVKGLRGVYLEKKTYCVEMSGKDEKTGEVRVDYHIRAKGITNDSIRALAEELQMTPLDLYMHVYNGGALRLDQLAAPSGRRERPKFKQHSEMYITSLTEYSKNMTIVPKHDRKRVLSEDAWLCQCGNVNEFPAILGEEQTCANCGRPKSEHVRALLQMPPGTAAKKRAERSQPPRYEGN
jgi:hypothetical protein